MKFFVAAVLLALCSLADAKYLLTIKVTNAAGADCAGGVSYAKGLLTSTKVKALIAPACTSSSSGITLTTTISAQADALKYIQAWSNAAVIKAASIPCGATITASSTKNLFTTISYTCSNEGALCCPVPSPIPKPVPSPKPRSPKPASPKPKPTPSPKPPSPAPKPKVLIDIYYPTSADRDCEFALEGVNALLNEVGLDVMKAFGPTCRTSRADNTLATISVSFKDEFAAESAVSALDRESETWTELSGLPCDTVVDVIYAEEVVTLDCSSTSYLCCSDPVDPEDPVDPVDPVDPPAPKPEGPYTVAFDIVAPAGATIACAGLTAAVATLSGTGKVTTSNVDCSTDSVGTTVILDVETETDVGILRVYLEAGMLSFIAGAAIPCGSVVSFVSDVDNAIYACTAADGAFAVPQLCCGSAPVPSPVTPVTPATPSPVTPVTPVTPGPIKTGSPDTYITVDFSGPANCDKLRAAMSDMITLQGAAASIRVDPYTITSILPTRCYVAMGFISQVAATDFLSKVFAAANFPTYVAAAGVTCGSTFTTSTTFSPVLSTYSCASNGFPNNFAAPALCCTAPPTNPIPVNPGPSPIVVPPTTPSTPTTPTTPTTPAPGGTPVYGRKLAAAAQPIEDEEEATAKLLGF